MRFYILLLITLDLTLPLSIVNGQVSGMVSGMVVSSGDVVPFANIGLIGTIKGATTDLDGKFIIDNVPFGTYELVVSYVGYEKWKKTIILSSEQPSVSIKATIKMTLQGLDEIVVTGTRSEKRRLDSAVPVNVLNSRVLESTQSLNLSEGLSFQPGIRVEKDCQTCNYTQVRMNGLAGSYTQILINSKPLFSSLAGLYGLEQIPVSMIDRVEVVKGGGSVLYGSNAIAGTINIITRDPASNKVELASTGSLINGDAGDLQTDLYTSLINKKSNAGISLIASQRYRDAWDANGDGFSELAKLENLSFGFNSFFIPGQGSNLRLGFNSINEIRNGGDQLNKEPHLRMQSEYRNTEVLAANIDYTQDLYGSRTKLSLYTGIQQTTRDHYTGSYGADGYGSTDNQTFIAGTQLQFTFLNFISGKNIITTGTDYQYDYVFDEIQSYNYLIRQETFQTGVFIQSDWDIHPRINLVTGLRWSDHNKVSGGVFSPRINLLYKATTNFQIRASRSNGFRAPQAFDTDMHIAFSGGGISLTAIDPKLKSEESVSYSASVDYNYPKQKYIYGFTINAFHTTLHNTFILEEKSEVGNNTILNRTNGGKSVVQGLTLELRGNYNYLIEGDIGLTIQQSHYENPVNWSNSIPGTTTFLRTPDAYGYFTLIFSGLKKFKFSSSGVFTGPMKIPHFAGAPGVNQDTLISSNSFFELNFKIEYQMPKFSKRFIISVSSGVQNVFNSFQQDFDAGPSRDSNYIYGPGRPTTVFMGLRIVAQ